MEILLLGAAIAATTTKTNKTNRQQFKVFNTKEKDPAKFWDSLNKGTYHMLCGKRSYHTKLEVGQLALHNGFMTANTLWDCTNKPYKDLSGKQQRIIEATMELKDEVYTLISVRGCFGKLFKIN